MNIQGQHQFGNFNSGKDSETNVMDEKSGQFSTFDNTIQNGKMNIAGNHQFNNFENNGLTNIMPRTFNPDGSPVQLLII